MNEPSQRYALDFVRKFIGGFNPFVFAVRIRLVMLQFFNCIPMGIVTVKAEAYGVTHITRHPRNMSFLLFGLAHMLVACRTLDWFFLATLRCFLI